MMWKRLVDFCFVILLVACAGTHIEREEAYFKDSACGEKHFLWKAEKDGRIIWLLGSIHLADSSFYPLPSIIDSAFEASTVLAAELDMNKEETKEDAQTLFVKKGMLPTGTRLDSVLPQGLFSAVDSVARTFGIPMQALERFRPWMVALSLSAAAMERAGLSGNFGIDLEMLAWAEDRQKKIYPIETPQEQVDVFAGDGDSLGVEYLKRTLDEIAVVDTLIPAIANAWKCGEVLKLRDLLDEGSSEDIYEQKIYTDRNEKMARSVDSLSVAGETVFAVVGAAHLVKRNDNVLRRLENLGYRIFRE